MHPNRNDEPDLMAATRASGPCSGIEQILRKIHQKQKRGVRGGGSPPPRAGRPPRAPEARATAPFSKLQNVILLLVFGRTVLVPSKVIFGLFLAITYTSQIKVIVGAM